MKIVSIDGRSGVVLAYRDTLDRLGRLAGVPPELLARVVADETLTLGGVPLLFRLEPWSAFIKVYVEVGRPPPEREAAFHRCLLEQQLLLPAPFTMLAGVDPKSGNVLLYGCAPLPEDAGMDEELLAFLHGCSCAAELMRSDLEQRFS